ncbi:MAG: hypothetical protein ACYC4K_06745, partial [Thiobacillus sp.]
MKLRTLLFGTLLVVFSFGVRAADTKVIESKVAELNQQSIKILGVSLNALRYLVGASSTDYLLLSSLEQSGDVRYIRELEAKGYVKVQTVRGLPDGTEKNTK